MYLYYIMTNLLKYWVNHPLFLRVPPSWTSISPLGFAATSTFASGWEAQCRLMGGDTGKDEGHQCGDHADI